MNKKKIRKKNKEDFCIVCRNSFLHHTWDTQKCCSIKCSQTLLKNRVEVTCNTCNKSFEIPKSQYDRNLSKGNKFYCGRNCYNNSRVDNPNRLKRSTSYNQKLLTEGSCIDCGENRYYLLQIHHVDSDPSNNTKSNYEVVCANCHIRRHLKLNKLGRYVYSTKHLTNRNLLKDL